MGTKLLLVGWFMQRTVTKYGRDPLFLYTLLMLIGLVLVGWGVFRFFTTSPTPASA